MQVCTVQDPDRRDASALDLTPLAWCPLLLGTLTSSSALPFQIIFFYHAQHSRLMMMFNDTSFLRIGYFIFSVT